MACQPESLAFGGNQKCNKRIGFMIVILEKHEKKE